MTIEHSVRPFELKAIDEKGTFSGYGSVFGVEDSYGDIVAPGAFKRSLAEQKAKGRAPAMLWQHNTRQPIGAYKSMNKDREANKMARELPSKYVIECVKEIQSIESALMQVNADDYAAVAADPLKSPRRGHADDLWRRKFGHSDPRGGGPGDTGAAADR